VLLLLLLKEVDKYGYSYVYSLFWLFFFLLSLLKDGGQERWEQASLAGTSKSLILLEFLSVNVLVVYARVRFAWKLKGKSIYVVVSYCCGWSYAVGVVVLRTCILPLVLFARFLPPILPFFILYSGLSVRACDFFVVL